MSSHTERIASIRERVLAVRQSVEAFANTLNHKSARDFVAMDLRGLDDVDGRLLRWAEASAHEHGRTMLIDAAERQLAALVQDVAQKQAAFGGEAAFDVIVLREREVDRHRLHARAHLERDAVVLEQETELLAVVAGE